jgi:hypothetical protein
MGKCWSAGKELGMKHGLQFRALGFDIGQLLTHNCHPIYLCPSLSMLGLIVM